MRATDPGQFWAWLCSHAYERSFCVSNVSLTAALSPLSVQLFLLRTMIPTNAPILISLVATAYLAIVYLVLTIAQRTRRLRRP